MKTITHFKLLLFLLAFSLGPLAHAQSKDERSSPPKQASAVVSGSEVVITYSSPSKKNRVIFGELLPYGKIWRTGANEASTITLSGDLKVGGSLVKAGKYGLFTIPGEGSWDIILNEVWDQWGHYNYDASKDVVRFSAPVEKLKDPVENFTIDLNADGKVSLMWDDVSVSFQIQ